MNQCHTEGCNREGDNKYNLLYPLLLLSGEWARICGPCMRKGLKKAAAAGCLTDTMTLKRKDQTCET